MFNRFSNKTFLVKAGVFLGWLIIAFVIIPQLIHYVFYEVKPDILQAAMKKHAHVTFEFLQAQWRDMAIFSTLTFLVFAVFAHYLKKPEFTRKVVGEATPGALGAIRALACFILLINILWEDLPSSAAIPRELGNPLGVMKLFHLIPGYEYFLASPTALLVYQILTGVLLFLGMIGLYTRKVLPFAAIFYLVFAGIFREYAWFYHTGLLPIFVLFVLTLTPAADGFSLDSLRTIWKTGIADDTKPAQIYGWSRYAIWLVIAIPYVGAGLSKLRNGGLFWWDAVNFKHIMFYSTLRPMEFDFDIALLFVNAPDFIIEMMAIIALLGEALYGLVLFSSVARILLPGAMLLMHIGILFLQNILFFDLIILQAVYWDFTKIRKFAGNTLNEKYGRLKFSYDEKNEFWQRAVLILKRLDLFERINFSARTSQSLQPENAGFVMVRGEKRDTGITALSRVCRVIPGLWILTPFLFILSGFRSLAQNPVSALEQKRIPEPSKKNLKESSSNVFANSPKLSITILAILSLCWVFRIEFYPLTAMQMFSKFRHNIVEYELVKAHLASGEIVRAPIEQSIGAMSDSRYRRILEMAFSEKKQALCASFMQTCADRWNAAAGPQQKIEKIEVQRWQWDFIGDKDNPNHGVLLDSKIFEMR